MNNPLHLVFSVIPVSILPSSVIPADYFEYFDTQTQQLRESIRQTKQAADVMITDAEIRSGEIVSEAKEQIKEMYIKGRQQAINDSVEWLCDVSEMEKYLADRLSERWQQATHDVLYELFGKSDRTTMLLTQILGRIKELTLQGYIVLSVSSADFEHISNAVSKEGVEKIRINMSPELVPGKAYLDNGVVRIHFDITEYLAAVLGRLAGNCEE